MIEARLAPEKRPGRANQHLNGQVNSLTGELGEP